MNSLYVISKLLYTPFLVTTVSKVRDWTFMSINSQCFFFFLLWFGRPLANVIVPRHLEKPNLTVAKINHVACLFFLSTPAANHSLVVVCATFFLLGMYMNLDFFCFICYFFVLFSLVIYFIFFLALIFVVIEPFQQMGISNCQVKSWELEHLFKSAFRQSWFIA